MSEVVIEQQEHGYQKGHQLLSSSVKLAREDQDVVDRLSDISGQLRPKETFAPYLTAYPLPSRTFYVLARTWQDLDAPRAGCVLTRSLFVRMSAWEGLTTIQPLLELLTPVKRGEKARSLSLATPGRAVPPPVVEPYTVELTEALFLEARAPTLVMDTARAEGAAVRVLTAIWPRLRRNFAVCTYALAPRKIEGRDFDLLFAPKTARIRFAEWRGRRIESGQSPPRHRWSVTTARQIFEEPDPRLTAVDRLGLLEGSGDEDDGNLRLVLLWNELSAKTDEVPTAVLGLLDIANSQGANGKRLRASLIPAVVRSLSLSREALPETEAWRFTTTLLRKFNGEAPSDVVRSTLASAEILASRDPEAALRFLQSEASEDREVPSVIVDGVAQGVAQGALEGLAPAFAAISPEHVLQMLAASPDFAKRVAGEAKRAESWIEPIVRALRHRGSVAAAEGANNLLPSIDDAALAPVLAAIVSDTSPTRLAEAAWTVGRNTHFDVPELSKALISAAGTLAHQHHLRDAVAASASGPGADTLLLQTLRLDGESLDWLGRSELPPPRIQRLLLALLANERDGAVSALAADSRARANILESLSWDISGGADAIARVIVVSQAPISEALSWFDKIAPVASQKVVRWTAAAMLERALVEGAGSTHRLQQLLKMAGADVDGSTLVRWALPNGASVSRWASNLAALNAAPAPVRSKIVAHIDLLTERLIRGARDNLGLQAHGAWAALLRDSRNNHPAAHERAALQALDFALSHERWPLGLVAEAAFPAVHARLPKSRSAASDTLLGAMLSIPLAMMGELDRAKSARRALVSAFMHSNWPPALLVTAGLKAGVDQKLLRLVAESYRGEAYLHAIALDAESLPPNARQRVLKALARFGERES